jgi:DNA invertase Pin-like site-specific DNA recombinase
MEYAYLRVSTKEQNLERQINAVKEYCSELVDSNIFSDKQSGKDFARTEYCRLKEKLQPGDEVIIKELDRLGRNKEEIKTELRELRERKVIVRILNVPTTLIDYQGQEWIFDMVNNILIEVLGAISEEERNKIRSRQREGIDAMPVIDGKRVSLKTGRELGRPKKEISDFQKILQKQKDGEISVAQGCAILGIGRSKWYELSRT